MTIQTIFLGTDLVDCQRIQTGYNQYGTGFLEKFLTPEELAYCFGKHTEASPPSWLFFQKAGARIAAKEAVAKALGNGLNGMGYTQGSRWHDIVVVSEPNHPPTIVLTERAQQRAIEKGITQWKLSLSHEGSLALATVLGMVTTP